MNIDNIRARNNILTLQRGEMFWGGKRGKIQWDVSVLTFLKSHVNRFVEKGGGQRVNVPGKSYLWNHGCCRTQGTETRFFSTSLPIQDLGTPDELLGDTFKVNRKKWFFSHSVVKRWNSLLQDLVDALSLYKFKKQVAKLMERKLFGSC